MGHILDRWPYEDQELWLPGLSDFSGQLHCEEAPLLGQSGPDIAHRLSALPGE